MVTREQILGYENVPTLPSVVTKILELVLDEKSSARDVARLIEADQALATRILRVVNSAAYGLPNKVATVQQSISLVGFNTLKSLVLSVSIYGEFSKLGPGEGGLNKVVFWQHCVAVAAASRSIAKQVGYPKPDEAYMAGILHDLGKVVLEDLEPKAFQEHLKRLQVPGGLSSVEIEGATFGLNHAQVGGWLCERWNLPNLLTAAVCHHHATKDRPTAPEDEKKLTGIIQTADFMTWTQGLGSLDIACPPCFLDRAAPELTAGRIDEQAVVKAVESELGALAEIFRFPMPDPNRFREALQKANLELGKLNTLYAEAKRGLERRLEELSALNAVVRKARQSLNTEEVIGTILGSLREGLGFDRAFIFFVKGDAGCVQGHAFSDQTNMVVNMDEFVLPVDPAAGRLHAAFKSAKPALVQAADANPAEKRVLDYLETTEIGIVPVESRQKVIGLILVDNAFSRLPIRQISMESLSLLGHEAGLAIENARLYEETRALAMTDELTQVSNRRHCLQLFEREFLNARRYKRDLSVLMLDIDNFKKFNDHYGHDIGDRVLRTIAQLMKKAFRRTDVIGRFGGEEFVAVLPETSLDNAVLIADRFRRAVQRFGELKYQDLPGCRLTVSIGAASISEEMTDCQSFLKAADQALYRGKEQGRNRVVPFTSKSNAPQP